MSIVHDPAIGTFLLVMLVLAWMWGRELYDRRRPPK